MDLPIDVQESLRLSIQALDNCIHIFDDDVPADNTSDTTSVSGDSGLDSSSDRDEEADDDEDEDESDDSGYSTAPDE